jgi:hypothetical protein
VRFDPVIPQHVIVDRGVVVASALKKLPDHVLEAMVVGLESNIDRLRPGRLFSGDGGGCVVGVTLKELYPARYDPGRVRWLYQRRMKGIGWDREIANKHVRLRHVELAFDRCVEMTRGVRRDLAVETVVRAVGMWFSAEAQAELERRRRETEASPTSNAAIESARPVVLEPRVGDLLSVQRSGTLEDALSHQGSGKSWG